MSALKPLKHHVDHLSRPVSCENRAGRAALGRTAAGPLMQGLVLTDAWSACMTTVELVRRQRKCFVDQIVVFDGLCRLLVALLSAAPREACCCSFLVGPAEGPRPLAKADWATLKGLLFFPF